MENTKQTPQAEGVGNDVLLAPFKQIASTCNEDECCDIILDCEESGDPTMQGAVKNLYEKRLKFLKSRRSEVEHYEECFSQG